MKQFFIDLFSSVRSSGRWIAIGIAILLLAGQLCKGISYLVQNSDHFAIISASDDDAGWAIRKTMRTRWWNDNGWAHYGPVYFRLNHTLQYWLAPAGLESPTEQQEKSESAAHFSIMLLSLFSVYLLSLLLVSLLLKDWTLRIISTGLLAAAFLRNPVYSELVLRAHPDHLFALLCTIAGLFTLKFLSDIDAKNNFFRAGIFWGLATATKLSTALMAPGFFALFFPPFRQRSVRKFLLFVGVMFVTYLAIGFPQSFVFDRPIRFLLQQNRFSVAPDFESVESWLNLFWTQLWLPTFVIVGLGLSMRETQLKITHSAAVRMGVFVFISFCLMISRKILSPYAYYTFPLNGLFLLVLVSLIPRLVSVRIKTGWAAMALIAVWWWAGQGMGQSFQGNLEKLTSCRGAAQSAYAKVNELIGEGEKVWSDPYFPIPTRELGKSVEMDWAKSWETMGSGDFGALALNRTFFQRYLPMDPSDYVKKDVKEWKEAGEFYRSFDGLDHAVSPSGRVLNRIFSDSCGFEIWRIEKGN